MSTKERIELTTGTRQGQSSDIQSVTTHHSLHGLSATVCIFSLHSLRGSLAHMSSESHFRDGETEAQDFTGGTSGKESTCNAGDTEDTGSIPGSGRFPGGGNGDPLRYSCLENPMDGGTW